MKLSFLAALLEIRWFGNYEVGKVEDEKKNNDKINKVFFTNPSNLTAEFIWRGSIF